MNLTEQRELAAEAAFSGYEWPTEPAVALAWSASDCGEKLVRPILVDAEIGRFEVAFDPETAEISNGGAWLNGEPIGSCQSGCPVHP